MGRNLIRQSQGLIIDPFSFNIFLCDLFWLMYKTAIGSYADDNFSGDSIGDAIKSNICLNGL